LAKTIPFTTAGPAASIEPPRACPPFTASKVRAVFVLDRPVGAGR
jgi:hypothetical protein